MEELHQQLEGRFDKLESLFWYARAVPGKSLSQIKREFFQSLPRAEGILRTVQNGNNYLLQQFKYICEGNDISYWIPFGTLLGAARHGGFIPWDDEVDVSLLCSDFEKLQMVLEKHSTFALRPFYSEEGHYYLYKMILRGEKNPPFWVDITIWDCASTKNLGETQSWKRIVEVREKTICEFKQLEKNCGRHYHSEQLTPPHVDMRSI